MKLFALIAVHSTAATTVLASPLIGEKVELKRGVNPRVDLPPQCREVSPGQENAQVFGTKEHKNNNTVTDFFSTGLFSYSRPDKNNIYGNLNIANSESGRKVIELWSGPSRISYEIDGHSECISRLEVANIDHYRLWKY